MTVLLPEPNEIWLKHITAGGWWEEIDDWRREYRRRGIITASEDRQIRRIKAYWAGLPVRQKRSGKTTPWLKRRIEEFLDWHQRRAFFDGLIWHQPHQDFELREQFRSLDEVYEYLEGSGLIEETGTDEKGRTVWAPSEYVQIVWQENGFFGVYVKEADFT